MLLVKTHIHPSPIEGYGLFASHIIPYGTLIWVFDPVVDVRIPKSSLIDLDPMARDHLMKRCYVNPENPEFIVMCLDNGQFMNFSSFPNTRIALPRLSGELSLIANAPIYEGQEITVALESDADADRKLSSYRTKSLA